MKAVEVPVLRGRRVTLRPYRPEEYGWAGALLRGWDGWVAGPPSADRLRRRMRRSGLLWRGRLILGMEAGGRLLGEIQTYHHTGMRPQTLGLGIMIFDPSDRGAGIGTEAVMLLTDWVLESGTAATVEAGTRPHNRAMRRVFERTGWTHTGTERAFGKTWATYERTAQT